MNIDPARAERALEEGKALLRGAPRNAAFTPLCQWLRKGFPQYNWVGVYLLEGQELSLAAWDGENATEHTTIPLAMGICGMAAREKRTINVKDVRKRPEYLACFLETRSEIVVPIMDGRTCLGEIDIDGKTEGAYDASDESFLERLAVELVPFARAELRSSSSRA
ncbi:MAG: GAF domain-containing protein [Euryarchaeota archaeon]|nr:GAF domain-containing protein [Euryarchaeota archaeon]MDE1836134.1 GAF domain-containing protein [Euryarchaeota archaeon]MDE1879424.1 GAF domain-containing protein [Euryarchaeota archaeon]MDE2044112.1 GAF domain-containing protein [Thermoplasmata archaeon]